MPKAFITDIDGTLTDAGRRLSLDAVSEIRRLVDMHIPVVFASGNTLCFLDGFSHMVGTDGKVIAENGGVYRNGFLEKKHVEGDRAVCIKAYERIVAEFKPKGDELRLFSFDYRYSDLAFSRDVEADAVSALLKDLPLNVIDTGFAIHLQAPGISKGAAFSKMAALMGLKPSDFLAAGDSINDISMLKLAGTAVVPQNASAPVKELGFEISEKPYGEGIADALRKYF
ncbi:MAG TPA: phosphoglycolate phosphatase [Methanocorpusculum sp.]|nr:phosphoglycolate phosphatase [Methanocorpusculum sp.]